MTSTAAVGVGECSMGCHFCQSRMHYKEIADRHFLDGVTMTRIAEEEGCTKAHISSVIKKIFQYGYRIERVEESKRRKIA